MNIEIPVIQLAELSNASSLAKLAEKTFRFEILGNKTFALGSAIQQDYIFARSIP
jgi:hypothetical protein